MLPLAFAAANTGADLDGARAARGDLAGRRPLLRANNSVTAALAPSGGTPADWHPLGPFGGDVTDVAASPTDPNLILAGIAPGGGIGGTLYRSVDGAANWLAVPALAFHSVYDIEFSPNGDVAIATDSGVWTSTDGGATWTAHDLGIGSNQQVFDIALDPGDASVLWAGVADGAGMQPANLIRSGDGGATWTNLTPPHEAAMSGMGIAVDPNDSDTVIAVFGGAFGGGEVWITTDGGATWTDRSAGLPGNPMRAVVYDGARLLVGGGQLFGSEYVGLFSSDDLGATWTELDDTSWPVPVVSGIAVDPTDAQTIFVSIDGAGVNRSSDGGATWQVGVGGSGSLAAQSIRFKPGASSDLLLGVSSLGVYRSTDAGASFAAASTGISELSLYSIDASPIDANELAVAFQANNSGGILTSADGGASWSAEPVPPTRYSNVRFAPDGTLYAISSGPSTIAPEGLYRRNGDGSWSGLGPDQGPLYESDLDATRFSADDPNLILLGGADFGVAGNLGTIWRSDDAGQTWVKQYQGESADKVKDIEIVPASADQNVLAVYENFDGGPSGAWHSPDGGLTWSTALNGLPTFVRSPRLCTSAANPGAAFMSFWDSWTTGAIYRTDDNGDSWVSTGWQGDTIADIACAADDAQVLYIAQSGANPVARSDDQGVTFTAFSDGLALAGSPAELALSQTGAPRLYLAGSHGSFGTDRDADDVIFANGFD